LLLDRAISKAKGKLSLVFLE